MSYDLLNCHAVQTSSGGYHCSGPRRARNLPCHVILTAAYKWAQSLGWQ